MSSPFIRILTLRNTNLTCTRLATPFFPWWLDLAILITLKVLRNSQGLLCRRQPIRNRFCCTRIWRTCTGIILSTWRRTMMMSTPFQLPLTVCFVDWTSWRQSRHQSSGSSCPIKKWTIRGYWAVVTTFQLGTWQHVVSRQLFSCFVYAEPLPPHDPISWIVLPFVSPVICASCPNSPWYSIEGRLWTDRGRIGVLRRRENLSLFPAWRTSWGFQQLQSPLIW